MRKAGTRVRIVAQLIDATSGEHVWAETYDRELTDVFAVQDEISSAIAASLVGDLQRAEQVHARIGKISGVFAMAGNVFSVNFASVPLSGPSVSPVDGRGSRRRAQ